MKSTSRRKFLKRGMLGVLGLLFADAFWFEKHFIDWNVHNLELSKGKIRVLQISDLHLKSIRSVHKQIAKRVNAEPPHILVFTGDSIDEAQNIDLLDKFLNFLDHGIPKYAILGNWEYWGNVDLAALKQVYSKHGCQLLINESVTTSVSDISLTIVGIDDYVGGNADFTKATEQLSTSDICLVMTHCPAHRDVIYQQQKELKIDLVLSGHTHGGQFNFLGWAPFTPPGSGKYLKGWYASEGPRTYVSRGIGTSMLPFRFGSRAEIVEFVL